MAEEVNPTEGQYSPKALAVSVALSAFVGMMSLFVAVLAFAVAGRQDNPNAGTTVSWSNETATWLSYFAGIASVVNGMVSFARARLRPKVAAVCTVVFIFLTILTNALFVRAW